MNPQIVLADALAELDALGSADKIAAYLRAEGVTGLPRKADACPVANWLHDRLPWPCMVTVASHTRLFRGDIEFAGAPTPEAVRRFVMDFDLGGYPQLRPGAGGRFAS